MDINYENIHYQRIGMFNGKLDKIPNGILITHYRLL